MSLEYNLTHERIAELLNLKKKKKTFIEIFAILIDICKFLKHLKSKIDFYHYNFTLFHHVCIEQNIC